MLLLQLRESARTNNLKRSTQSEVCTYKPINRHCTTRPEVCIPVVHEKMGTILCFAAARVNSENTRQSDWTNESKVVVSSKPAVVTVVLSNPCRSMLGRVDGEDGFTVCSFMYEVYLYISIYIYMSFFDVTL